MVLRQPLIKFATLTLLFALLLSPLAARAAQPWGPVLGNVTTNSIQIGWRDAAGAPVKGVKFADHVYAGTVDDGYRLVTLRDLQPDTEYQYTFLTANAPRSYSFRTAPATQRDFTFAVYGDTRTGVKTHRKVVSAVQKLKPAFVLNTGDLVTDGRMPKLWEEFYGIIAPLSATTPYFVAAGNHEQNSDYFFRTFPGASGGGVYGREWYGFTYGNVHAIVLNSTRKVAEQRDWLAQHLAERAGKDTWTVVAFHYPPYSSSARNGDATMQREWVPILEKYKVDAVFLGHDHFYERSAKGGIQYIICGGGGAPLYAPNAKKNPYQQHAEKSNHYLRVDATATTLHIRMFRLDGKVGDEVMLKK